MSNENRMKLLANFSLGRFARITYLLVLLLTISAKTHAESFRIALVSHAPDGDPWWEVVKNGVKDADADFGVSTDYLNAPQGGAGVMKPMLEKLAGYDAVISTLADFSMTLPVLQDISGRRVPLITINNGSERESESAGAVTHIGIDDYRAGKQVGQMAKNAGASSLLCISHLQNSTSALARCNGFVGMLGSGGHWELLKVGKDPLRAKADIASRLSRAPFPDSILALGPLSAEPAIEAIREGAAKRTVFFATFDYSPKIVDAIRNGIVQVAVDQQPYLQGYLPVALLAIMLQEKTTATFNIRRILNQNESFKRRIEKFNLTPSYLMKKISTEASLITIKNVETVAPYAGSFR